MGDHKEQGINIDPAFVRALAELLDDTQLSEIEVEDGDRKVRVARTLGARPGKVFRKVLLPISRPRRSRKPKVGSGSKIEVHTVLKLTAEAIIATYTSSGASSGVATSPTCSDLRGSLSAESTPSHMPVSERDT